MTQMQSAGDRVYIDEPYVSVRWDSGGGWVIAEWKAWATSSELRAAHETALLALVENRASKWLIDARAMRVVVKEDQRWLAEDFVPRMVAAGAHTSAVVLPKSGLASMNMEDVARNHPLTPVQRRVFATLDEAKAWLRTA